jgi:uncharacterized LabA/DUF88 family protein
MIADELRRQCDTFIDLATLAQKIGRDPALRQDRDGVVDLQQKRPQGRAGGKG